MRKFAIAIVLTALAILGFGAGPASAQQEDVEEVVKTTLCPWNNAIAGNGGPNLADGDPSGTATGACDGYPAISQDYLIPDYVPCDVLGAVGNAAANNGVPAVPDVTTAIRDGVPCEGDGGGDDDDDGPPADDDDDDDTNGDDDTRDPQVEGEVVSNNAASDGSLPRTGGELQLLGGLSMGLTGLGIFARRFLG